MKSHFDLNSWSKEYLRDALREAEARHLLEETRQNRWAVAPRAAWRSLLAPLRRGTRVAGW